MVDQLAFDYEELSFFIFSTLPNFFLNIIVTLSNVVNWMFTDYTFEFLDNTLVVSPVEVIFGASAPLILGFILLKFFLKVL